MREIRTSGSEGGGIETNRCSLPLSVTPVGRWLLDCPVKPGDDRQSEGEEKAAAI
jgi:hypothetical protein